ncbi:AAA family ATPase [Streptomyces sp. NPDC059578]|uniref:helix-turn-helix transcriptional regulator n=1 Tax=unclassified Streptomyces TaxID=2593676 RepID=UPI00365DB4A6
MDLSRRGREAEAEVLRGMLARTALGRGGSALISGPVGCGKSELLHAFAEGAADGGAVVLSAACSETEGSTPFSTIAQAFHQAPLRPEQLRGLHETAPDQDCLSFLTHGTGDPTERVERLYPPVVHQLWQALLDLSARQPVVIVIDDVDRADEFSLRGLAFIARRIRSARVMVVVAAQTGTRRTSGFLQSEVLRQPSWQQIRLAPMSVEGVAQMLTHRFGDDTGAHAWYDVSRGNPLLLKALLEDYPTAAGTAERSREPIVGQSFAEAMSACLHRCGPELAEVAVTTAVLGENVTVELVADLMGTVPEAVLPWIRALDSAGVLADGRFTHAAGRAAVLAPLTRERSARLHRRAAERLYYAGAAPAVVADALLAADEDDLPPWSCVLLREAGTQAVRDGEIDRVVECLELAYRIATEPQDRVSALNLLFSAHWRLRPGGCGRHVDRLLDAVREGCFAGDVSPVVSYLLWHERFADAEMLLTRVAAPDRELPLRTRVELRLLRLSLAYRAPGLLGRLAPEVLDVLDADLDTNGPGCAISMSPQLQAIRALEVVLGGGDPDEATAHAEHVLQNCGLDDSTADVLFTMLSVLVDMDRSTAALPWCEALLAEAERRNAPAWSAVLLDVRAAVALRTADFPAADAYAQRALTRLAIENRGPFLTGPLATQLHARTAMGQHDQVADLLMQPVPEVSFQTTSGLRYWHAKGLYYVTTNRLPSAITTLRACGELSVAWQIDLPAVLPWRTGMAHAMLHAGHTDRARVLMREQLGRSHRNHARVRGVSLQILAHTAELSERPRLLKEAIEQLQSCPGVLEQAHVLSDLSKVLHRLGDGERARITGRRARLLADRCHATLVDDRGTVHGAGGARNGPSGDAGDDSASVLSEAEHRVATLASRGDKNLEIARKLSITVSTVEQHLTRVYRKLQVQRRADLPDVLETLAVENRVSSVGSF